MEKISRAGITISCRISVSQDNLLESFAEKFQQRKSDLIREAIQLWINKQVEEKGLPEAKLTE